MFIPVDGERSSFDFNNNKNNNNLSKVENITKV